MRPYHIVWLLCFVAFAAFIGLKISSSRQGVSVPVDASSVAGTPLGGPFTLTDHTGKKVTETSWPDKYLLLYFGFTHCPDICPVGLNRMIDALNQLSAEQRARIQPIFITVDPARDTVAVIKDYVVLFDKNLVGLTGTEKEIDQVKKLYRVYAQKSGTDENYMVNHSGYTYLMTPKGDLAHIFAHETTVDDVTAELKKIVKISE